MFRHVWIGLISVLPGLVGSTMYWCQNQTELTPHTALITSHPHPPPHQHIYLSVTTTQGYLWFYNDIHDTL